MLDGLAGTGARGIRLAVEGPEMNIHINDRGAGAYNIILKNIRLNGLKGIRKNIKPNDDKDIVTSKQDLYALLPTGKWDWIDIDPYGSPIIFVDQAAQRLSGDGVLSVTATDTAPLCGTFSKACRRRYMAKPLNTGCRHETGLRILVGAVIRRAAVTDIALTPELAYYQGHFFRAYFRKAGSARKADALLKRVGYLIFNGGEYSISSDCPAGKSWAGPLWLGDLFERKLIREMLAKADEYMSKDTLKLLGILSDELLQPPYFYHTDDIARTFRVEPPRTAAAVDVLREQGFKASLVHYDTKGFRTDAGLKDLRKVLE